MRSRHGLAGYLLLPVALMPLASLLCFFGQSHSLLGTLLLTAGQTLFDTLPLIIAIQLACALQREAQGQQVMNSAVSFFILSSVMQPLAPDLHHAQIACALVAGVSTALCYPRLARLRLPPLLHSFKGPAIILILNSFIALILAFPLAAIFSWLEPELLRLGGRWLSNPEQGFALGFIYQLLTPFGLNGVLHPLLMAENGAVLSQPQQSFLSAHYAVQIFGLPGMALALLRYAPARRRHSVIGLSLLLALSGWITGATAPLVLALLFLSLPLFLTYALLAGFLMAFCQVIAIRFAIPHLAGDLSVLWSPELQRDPLQFYTLGAITLLLYAFGCQLCLKLFPLQPLSWEKELATEADRNHHASSDLSLLAVGYLKALGGIGNLISMTATLTYLTVEVENPALLDEAALQRLGVITRFELDSHKLQLLIGPIAVQLDEKIQLLAARQSLDLQPRELQIAPFIVR